jgi:hypothetical protein
VEGALPASDKSAMRKMSTSTDAIARRVRLSAREIALAVALTIAALTGVAITLGTQSLEPTQEAEAPKRRSTE